MKILLSLLAYATCAICFISCVKLDASPLEEPSNWRHSIIQGSKVPRHIKQSYKSVGVLPFFIQDKQLYLVLYRPENGKFYSDLAMARQEFDRSIAATAAHLFFPYQQHKNMRIQQLDWPSEKYLASMIFGGPWARTTILSMGNDHYTCVIDIHSPSSLKQTVRRPFIIVKFADLLAALNTVEQNGTFGPVSVIDSRGISQPIYDKFIQGIAKPDNISYLRWVGKI